MSHDEFDWRYLLDDHYTLRDLDPAPPSTTTVTYFVQAAGGGPIKIGRSRYGAAHRGRLQSLRTASPYILGFTRVLIGNHEQFLHTVFSDYRMCGEWFKPMTPLAELAHAVPEAEPEAARFTLVMEQVADAAYEKGWLAATDYFDHMFRHRVLESRNEMIDQMLGRA